MTIPAGAVADVAERVRTRVYVPPAVCGWSECPEHARFAAERAPVELHDHGVGGDCRGRCQLVFALEAS